jgi:hypothetical protein
MGYGGTILIPRSPHGKAYLFICFIFNFRVQMPPKNIGDCIRAGASISANALKTE